MEQQRHQNTHEDRDINPNQNNQGYPPLSLANRAASFSSVEDQENHPPSPSQNDWDDQVNKDYQE